MHGRFAKPPTKICIDASTMSRLELHLQANTVRNKKLNTSILKSSFRYWEKTNTKMLHHVKFRYSLNFQRPLDEVHIFRLFRHYMQNVCVKFNCSVSVVIEYYTFSAIKNRHTTKIKLQRSCNFDAFPHSGVFIIFLSIEDSSQNTLSMYTYLKRLLSVIFLKTIPQKEVFGLTSLKYP